MTSERRWLANQTNAKASTGPKTKAGKANSARNALRHGLTIPVSSDPAFVRQAEAIARKIAGRGANAQGLEWANRIGEAQVDLNRVRSLRTIAIASMLSDPLRTVQEIEKLATVLEQNASELARLDRYERRALSRRKFAIRNFDAVRAQSSDKVVRD